MARWPGLPKVATATMAGHFSEHTVFRGGSRNQAQSHGLCQHLPKSRQPTSMVVEEVLLLAPTEESSGLAMQNLPALQGMKEPRQQPRPECTRFACRRESDTLTGSAGNLQGRTTNSDTPPTTQTEPALPTGATYVQGTDKGRRKDSLLTRA